jgi:IS5 family transposase
MKRESFWTIVLDTNVQPKAIAHPTDSRLLNRAREQLVDPAQGCGIALRQSYVRVGRAAEHQAGRYAHARQYRRMRREIRRLRTWLGRVIRDIERKAPAEISQGLRDRLALAKRLHAQQRDSKNKLYALHAPEVECIAKGKACTPYEIGVKVSVAVTAREGIVVYMRSMPACAARLVLSHTRKLPAMLKRLLKRRQVVEPMIGQMKTDGLLARNWLKGGIGDALHAVLCGAGHNLQTILAHLRVLFAAFIRWLIGSTVIASAPR